MSRPALAILIFVAFSGAAYPAAIDLGTASAFAILGGQSVTNTGSTTIQGSIGVSPGTAVSGFAPGLISSSATAMQAQSDLTGAYGVAAGAACLHDLSGQNIGGLTLVAGVYCFNSSAQLTGTLTLDGEGDANAIFVFQIVSTLTSASNSSVLFKNAGRAGGLFWQVGSSATLGTGTAFAGNILALTDITLTTGATIECGRALARNGNVTLDSNTVSNAGCDATSGGTGAPVPEPSMTVLFATMLLLAVRRRLSTTGPLPVLQCKG